MPEWLPIATYKHTDFRDDHGKWHPGPPGPIVDLKFENGRVVRKAQWCGQPTRGGGTAYAFWTKKSSRGIGSGEPSHWRLAAP